jgi:hypothetical protein
MNVIPLNYNKSQYKPLLLNKNSIPSDTVSAGKFCMLTGCTLYTADGMLWFVSYGNDNCSNNICGYVWVDVNGLKEPNRAGVDIFFFDVTLDGVRPNMTDDCNDLTEDGYGCAAKVINDDAHLDFIFK